METTTTTARRILVWALLGALPLTAFAQPASFEGTAEVMVVEVPVNVTREGQSVRDLGVESFTLLVDGREHEITGFEVVDLAVPRAGTVPIAVRRHFLLLFDLSFSRPESILKARQAAAEVLAGLHRTDLVGVAVYSAVKGLDLILSFTTDRSQAELAVETLGAPELVARTLDPLGLSLGERQGEASGSGFGEVTMSSPAVLTYIHSAGAENQRAPEVNRVLGLFSALDALGELLAGIDGRKHLVLLSEGFDNRLLFGEVAGDGMQVGTPRLPVYTDRVDQILTSDQFHGNTRVQNELAKAIERLRRSDCIIQAVNVAGLRVGDSLSTGANREAALFAMARDTGGEMFATFNALGTAMSEMLEKNSVTYLLAFHPRKVELDGSFHRLKVKLRDAPRGTRIHHRMGYYNPKPFAEIGAGEQRFDDAELILSGEASGSLVAQVLATPFPVAGEEAFVPVLIEVAGRSLLRSAAGDEMPLKLYAYAFDGAGSVRDLVAENLALDLAAVGKTLRQSGLKFWVHFDLGAGEYALRVLVRNTRNGEYSMRTLPLTVPAFDAAVPLLLPPLFPEPVDKWVMTRETGRHREVPYPFMIGEEPYIPAAGPVVQARGRTPVYVTGFYLGSGALELRGEVTGADGTAVSAATFRVDEIPAPATGVHTAKGVLRTRGLGPGSYTLTVLAKAGGETLYSSIGFRVED